MATKFKRRGRKVDKTGRNSDHQYWNFPYSMAQCAALRLMSGHALKLLVELRSRYNGFNNGKIILSYEEACRLLAMSKGTVKRAFDELQNSGFLKLVTPGTWYGRRASEWCLTFVERNGQPPTDDWKLWQPPSRPAPPLKIKPRYPNGMPQCIDGSKLVPGER
jgi:hypothetical protein